MPCLKCGKQLIPWHVQEFTNPQWVYRPVMACVDYNGGQCDYVRDRPHVATWDDPGFPFIPCDPDCGYCGGQGMYYGHDSHCADDRCALAGGPYDCYGEVIDCGCVDPEWEKVNCPHGCETTRELTDAEGAQIMNLIRAITRGNQT